ncbi:MAG: hypothetical protein J3K34DRAFT_431885 [Monoraphidium minutum]|nr:MAG: hypothetical protein J3K34DRAFT_431885 [Monoraphidium minutum]
MIADAWPERIPYLASRVGWGACGVARGALCRLSPHARGPAVGRLQGTAKGEDTVSRDAASEGTKSCMKRAPRSGPTACGWGWEPAQSLHKGGAQAAGRVCAVLPGCAGLGPGAAGRTGAKRYCTASGIGEAGKGVGLCWQGAGAAGRRRIEGLGAGMASRNRRARRRAAAEADHASKGHAGLSPGREAIRRAAHGARGRRAQFCGLGSDKWRVERRRPVDQTPHLPPCL